jgi:hypothetical protein
MNPVTANMLSKGGFAALPKTELGAMRAHLLAAPGIPRVLPAAEVQAYPHGHMLQLMVQEGIYVWPTLELAEWLAGQGVDMEIGAGNGALAEFLGVRATDNYSQAADYRPEPKHLMLWLQGRAAMESAGQAFVTYGHNVERQEAMDAVIKHKPSKIYGCFITHRYRAGDKDGNQFGPDEEKLLRRCDYIMIGNAKTHANKRILRQAAQELYFPWLVTRGMDQSLNRIWTWNRTR